ncbi:MAG: ROK family protein [Micromonosporaceae bacterium]
MSDVVIAVDVGGTMTKCALTTLTGAVRHEERHPTGAEQGPDGVVEHILDIAAGLAATARAAGLTPRALGLAVPGIVDDRRGVASYSANLGWRDVPLRARAEQRLGLPVALGHDVRAGGLAEAALGAGRGAEHLLFVPIGTGIAAAHVIAGQVLVGAHGAALELGHVVVRPQGRRCGCGRRGCLESEASAAAVATRYHEQTGQRATAAQVADRARRGDPAAALVWRETVDVLADGLLAAITLCDPELIVIGGGLASAGDQLLTPLRSALDALHTFEASPRLSPAALGDRAGCLGAALLAIAAAAGSTGASGVAP